MKEDVQRYAQSCHQCQVHKAKYLQRTDEMVLPQHSNVPFEVIHLDFAELKKKAAGVRRTQSFLVAIDQCTRIVAARPGREDANSVIALLSRQMFKNTKIVISDNGPAFRSQCLQDLAKERGVVLRCCAPYHPAGNGMAERIIQDLKQFISMYPGFQGGWK
uniref:Putative tick transposon n=1 Tax=Rhipicephalus microplus TaxID=6941 RepID=A0A6G5AJQ7_RHIMP